MSTNEAQSLAEAILERAGYTRGEPHPFFTFEPLPYQRAFLQSTKKVAALCGGNQIGKSTAGAYWIASRLMGFSPPFPDQEFPIPGYYWACTKGDLLDGLIERVLQFIPPGDIARSRITMRPYIELKNGSWVRFKSYDQPREAFQQATLDGILNDEEMPRDIWQEQQTRLIGRRGRMRLTFTPIEGTLWVHQILFDEKKRDWVDVFGAAMTENVHLPKEEVEAYISQFQDDDAQFDIRVKGLYRLSVGMAVFPEQVLAPYRKLAIPPKEQMIYDPRKGTLVHAAVSSSANWQVWKKPVPGHRYVIGSDVADLTLVGSWTTAIVLDVDTTEIVARCRKKISPYEWGDELVGAGKFYNRALLAPEANNVGVATITRITEMGYPWVYRRTRFAVSNRISRSNIGWVTTGATKPLLVNAFAQVVSEGLIVIPDQLLLDEMGAFVRLAKDRPGDYGYGAASGNDDLVMAAMIAYQAMEQSPRTGQILGARRPRSEAERCLEDSRSLHQDDPEDMDWI